MSRRALHRTVVFINQQVEPVNVQLVLLCVINRTTIASDYVRFGSVLLEPQRSADRSNDLFEMWQAT